MFEKFIGKENLIRFPLSTTDLYISVTGKILDSFGEATPQTTSPTGMPQIFADLWDGPRFYLIADLMAIAFKGMKLPLFYWNAVSGFSINGNIRDLHASNIGYRFRGGPLENRKFPGFFFMPMYTQYCISEEGEIIHFQIGKPNNTWYKSKPPKRKNIKGVYFYKNLKFDHYDRWMNAPRHRLLAYAFKEYPNDVDKLDVNHIDGIPGNDVLSNLEWATRSRNNYHAVELGMKTAFKVLAKNVLTDEIIAFPSISQCASALGYPTDETIRFRLNHKTFGKVYADGYQFKLESDQREFPLVDDPQAAVRRARRHRPIVVQCKTSGSVAVYQTAKEAIKILGLKRATLEYRLKYGVRNNDDKYHYKYEDDERIYGV